MIWFFSVTAFLEGNAFLLFSHPWVTNLEGRPVECTKNTVSRCILRRDVASVCMCWIFHLWSLKTKPLATARWFLGRGGSHAPWALWLHVGRCHLETPLTRCVASEPGLLLNQRTVFSFSFLPPSASFSHKEMLICFIIGSCGRFYSLKGNMVCSNVLEWKLRGLASPLALTPPWLWKSPSSVMTSFWHYSESLPGRSMAFKIIHTL